MNQEANEHNEHIQLLRVDLKPSIVMPNRLFRQERKRALELQPDDWT